MRGPCQPRGPAFNDAGLAASGQRALDDDATRALLTAEHRAEVCASLVPDNHDQAKEQVVTTWAEERRRMARMHTLRSIAAPGCAVAALLPFVLAAWRWSWTFGEAASAFLAPPWGVLGAALALLAAGLLARRVARVKTIEGVLWLVIASFTTGVVGLALPTALG